MRRCLASWKSKLLNKTGENACYIGFVPNTFIYDASIVDTLRGLTWAMYPYAWNDKLVEEVVEILSRIHGEVVISVHDKILELG
ncbi:hypothetical protein VNO77_25251 [Canavalia gladiata]|uniref:Uncharacterized protein n=1 Tax=Canavalia gladiata TaxID=3824 RepID=A0AAN9LAA2_CANGL